MEEIQPETQNPSDKHVSLPLLAATILVAVYFLCPPVLFYPVFLAFRHRRLPPAVRNANEIIFYPVNKLADACPAYARLLQWEARLLGMG
jgi:hypothetical protein